MVAAQGCAPCESQMGMNHCASDGISRNLVIWEGVYSRGSEATSTTLHLLCPDHGAPGESRTLDSSLPRRRFTVDLQGHSRTSADTLEPLIGLEPIHHPYKRWVLPSHSERHWSTWPVTIRSWPVWKTGAYPSRLQVHGARCGNRTRESWLGTRYVTTSINLAWCGQGESNSRFGLGKPVRYHYNMPANWSG